MATVTKGQSEEARPRRLDEGRCPTHGTVLSQIGSWGEDGNDQYCRVGCPRRDCDFIGWTTQPFGPTVTTCPSPHNSRIETVIAALEAKWSTEHAAVGVPWQRMLADVRAELSGRDDVNQALMLW